MLRASDFLDLESESPAATASAQEAAAEAARKLIRSVGKAAWIAGTTFLVLGVPLLFSLEREAAFVEMDNLEFDRQEEMHALLGTGGSSSLPQ